MRYEKLVSRRASSLAYQLRVVPVRCWSSKKPLASPCALFALSSVGTNAWLVGSAWTIALKVAMDKANAAVLTFFTVTLPYCSY